MAGSINWGTQLRSRLNPSDKAKFRLSAIVERTGSSCRDQMHQANKIGLGSLGYVRAYETTSDSSSTRKSAAAAEDVVEGDGAGSEKDQGESDCGGGHGELVSGTVGRAQEAVV